MSPEWNLALVLAALWVFAFLTGWYRSRARTAERRTAELNSLLESGMKPDRSCPFCGVPIDPDKFACRTHWACLTEADRRTIWDAYTGWQNHKISGRRLREIQKEVIAKYAHLVTGRSPLPALAGVDRRQLEQVCLLFETFLAKDDEYRKCKEQFTDAKKKLGMEHRRLRQAVDAAIAAVLHPPQNQPALFDNSPDKPPLPKLPD